MSEKIFECYCINCGKTNETDSLKRKKSSVLPIIFLVCPNCNKAEFEIYEK